MDVYEKSLALHKARHGKIAIVSKMKVENMEDLSLAYTPGVAQSCKAIAEDRNTVYDYTSKGNLVAVISDGSAVLGLGNIGPEAALPVMEGKAILFKTFANIDAFPLCLDTQDVDALVQTIQYLAPTFGGINLEDISAPRCFEIEQRLQEALHIPVFHDDQHGTAIVVSAGIINALKVVKKTKAAAKVVISGAGSAGISIAKLLLQLGIKDITLVDLKGALCVGEPWMNEVQAKMATCTNPNHQTGNLEEIIKDKDIFIGVSAPNIVTSEMVRSMNQDAIVFAMANPIPEIMPDAAKQGGARIVATGRSDFPNQINNVLVFPGIFRGALDAKAEKIDDAMKLAAARAIAKVIKAEELCEDYIIPSAFDKNVVTVVAKAVADVAQQNKLVTP